MELNVYNTDGKKTGVITVSDEIFNAEYKEGAYTSNSGGSACQ